MWPLLTTNCWYSLFTNLLIHGYLDSSIIWPTFLNTLPTCNTSGKDNFVANTLSRSVIYAMHSELAIDFAAMATVQLNDTNITTYKTCATGLDLCSVPFSAAQIMLLCNVSTGCPCPLVPAIFRCAIFDVVHTCRIHPSDLPKL